MNLDEVILLVKNAKVDCFISYSITSDLYNPDGEFTLETYTGYDVRKGDSCQIFVNRVCEMVGIVQSVKRSLDRSGPKLTITGKSIASVLTSSCVTKFSALPTKLSAIAERLVKPLPFIGKKDFKYLSDAGKDAVKRKFVELSVGDTVFDVLKKAANSQGCIFFAAADGTFVFDKPKERGEASYRIYADLENQDYISGSVTETLEECHSDIIVMGESQSDRDIKYTKTTLKNKDFPFYRPLVVNWNENEGPAKKTAELRLATEKAQAIQLEYTMQGHSQNGENWKINTFCKVKDDYNGADGTYLIKSRTFTLDRNEGKQTRLALQPGGSL